MKNEFFEWAHGEGPEDFFLVIYLLYSLSNSILVFLHPPAAHHHYSHQPHGSSVIVDYIRCDGVRNSSIIDSRENQNKKKKELSQSWKVNSLVF